MTHKKLGRTLVGAALLALVSTFSVAPAQAVPPVPTTITWVGEIADGASFAFGQVPAAPTCQLAVPGDCVVSGYDQAVGQHTLTATAGTVTATRVYTVTAWTLKGFYKPVKMTGWNTVKGGSTVPLKFKVYTGDPKQKVMPGKKVKKLKKTSAVASILAQQVTCDAVMTPIGAAAPVAGKSKGFALKYRDGAYHQNWKTPKLVKPVKVKGVKPVVVPVCYVVTMTTLDGSMLKAQFKLR